LQRKLTLLGLPIESEMPTKRLDNSRQIVFVMCGFCKSRLPTISGEEIA
jgi:uncharacterized protein YlaI